MEESLAVSAKSTTQERFVLHGVNALPANTFADDVRRGLTGTPKSLSSHYLYDAVGSALFSAICELPEYYVTRAEDEILRAKAAEIASAFGQNVRIAELGSGSARKTRYLIDAILNRQPSLDFFPIDVDAGMLASSSRELLNAYPNLSITAICGDFRDPAALLRPYLLPSDARTIVLFLGSSIGNLDPAASGAMLANLRAALAPGDAIFLGADLRKSPSILEPAYDDALGVTAAFNLNLLARINRELGGTFDLASFAHRAFYDASEGRVEMHLVSKIAQRVLIDGYEVVFEEGESIHTENSHKYDDVTLDALATAGNFRIERRWTDSNGYFADLLLVAKPVETMEYSYAEYLALEASSNIKHEFLGGRIYEMAGGTPEHAALAAAVIGLLFSQLRSRGCRAYDSDLRVRTPSGLSTYPDVTVTCGSSERDEGDPQAVTNPTLIIEVLSPSTEKYDAGDKFEHYKSLQSLRQYVLVSHRERSLQVWTRGENAWWRRTLVTEGELAYLLSDLRLDVRELYDAAAEPGT